MNISRQSFLFIASFFSLALVVGCHAGPGSAGAGDRSSVEDPEDNVPRSLSAKQEGGTAYWVLPGPRHLSPTVFGTKDNPKRLVEPKIKQAKGTVPKLLKKLPLLVGLPESGPWGRSPANGGQILKHGSPFGNKMKPVPSNKEHFFRVTFKDNTLEDSGKPIDTEDDVEFSSKFADPQGNTYEIKIAKVFQPPIPGWQTEGGVVMNSHIGGTTGTFIPLFPKAYTYAAFWAVGKITINGEKTVPRVVVFYITESVRDQDGKLALDEQMPINAKGAQAHLLVPPIEPVLGKGPKPNPVPTEFDLPPKAPKDKQPFISIFFPNPEITEGHEHVRK